MTLIVNSSTTINGDQTPGTGAAITYGADNITVTINTGVAVWSLDNDAVSSSRSGSILVNVGNILGGASIGVKFTGSNGFIQNETGHNIAGAYGIYLNGAGETVNNYGTILGLIESGVIFELNSSSVMLLNRGDIYGRDEGIFVNSLAGGSIITNDGTMDSDHYGIRVTAGTLPTYIINSGTISGTEYPIRVEGTAAIELTNTGTIEGTLSCAVATGNDTVQNRGTITGPVTLGGGDDVFNGSGGKSGPIYGQTGNDTLTGGKGGDILWGGNDRDTFKFVSVKETGKGANRDQIMDFGDVAGEKIDVSAIDAKKGSGNQAFKFISTAKFHDHKGELRYIDKGATCIVQGDINGDGKADFEIFVNTSSLAKGDFVL